MPDTTDRPELLRCPFCGGEAHRHEVIEHYPASKDGPAGSYSAWFHIGCNVCGIEIGDEYESGAVAAWNKRAALSAAPPTDSPRHDDGSPAPEDIIAKAKRILAAVDVYQEHPTQGTRSTLRTVIYEQLEAAINEGKS